MIYIVIFGEGTEKKIRDVFERNKDRDFVNKYEKCKAMRLDPKFEKFYQLILNDPGEKNPKNCH